MKDRILNFIRSERISTANLADVLSDDGKWSNSINFEEHTVLPLVSGLHCVGETKVVAINNESNYVVHKELESLPEGSVLYVYTGGYERTKFAAFGHLISHYAINYKKAVALITNGFVRDTYEIIKDGLPVWSAGKTSRAFSKSFVKSYKPEWYDKLNGGLTICDDDGVMHIRPDQLTPILFEKIKEVNARESMWYKMLKEGKSTFEITCEPEIQ